MTNRATIRGLLGVLLVGLLAAPLLLQRWSDASSEKQLDRETALERYGFVLEETTQAVGIDFTHQTPDLDPKLHHILPEVAQVGASVSVADVDEDGHPDLYVTNSKYGTQNALYHNQGDGTFENVASELGVADVNRQGTGTSMGSVWGD